MFVVNSKVAVEFLGPDMLVVSGGDIPEAVKLSGTAAETFRTVQAGGDVDPKSPVVRSLEQRGILLRVSSQGINRRTLLTAGSTVGAAGVVAMALPSTAVASSSAPEQESGGITGPQAPPTQIPAEAYSYTDIEIIGTPNDFNYEYWGAFNLTILNTGTFFKSGTYFSSYEYELSADLDNPTTWVSLTRNNDGTLTTSQKATFPAGQYGTGPGVATLWFRAKSGQETSAAASFGVLRPQVDSNGNPV